MSTSRLILSLIIAAGLGTVPTAAQSCYPVAVLLEVRASAGGRVDPLALDSVMTTPTGGHSPAARVVREPYQQTAAPDSLNLLEWAISGCRLRVGTATLHHGGSAMRLIFDVWLDSEVRRG